MICKKCGKDRKLIAKGLCRICYDKEWYRKNEDVSKKRSKIQHEKKAEKLKIYFKKWYKKNKDKHKTHRKRRYYKNPEKEIERNLQWQKENPEKTKEYGLKRRANGSIKKGTISKLINENIFKYGIVTCEKCKEQCPNKYHIDHIVPVSKEGNNDYNNLQILCAKCNHEKFTKIMDYRKNKNCNQLYLKAARD